MLRTSVVSLPGSVTKGSNLILYLLNCPIKSRRFFSVTSRSVKVVEVGPRDGLQNENTRIPTSLKISLVNKLSKAGLEYIEVSSFVSPKWIPQLSDAADVFRSIERCKQTKYAALVPNYKGLLAALDMKVDEVAVFTAASEVFAQRNINCSIDESIKRFDPIFRKAKEMNVPVRGYVSCALGCPYQGHISPSEVARVVELLWKRGCREISLGDTVGIGSPESMEKLLSAIVGRLGVCPVEALAVHCHNTWGRALDNIDVALDMFGVRTVDASIGGLGGCPYAGDGASGNVATELVVSHLSKKGYTFSQNLRIDQLPEIGSWIRDEINKLKTN
ncbi:unnamed protein product [Calicophoron daubneyi]|uniref:hydroxymethylglutaryl-CoA lyase n=1 Tax=Calicophoron daubneyi TaxID=300641 RepID=A0AAV2TFT8_CALDB